MPGYTAGAGWGIVRAANMAAADSLGINPTELRDVSIYRIDDSDGTNRRIAETVYNSRGSAEALPLTKIWSANAPSSSTESAYTQYDRRIPATRGASTTGFGFTWAGGLGASYGTTRTYEGVEVTPGQTYEIKVASGTSLKITYLGKPKA